MRLTKKVQFLCLLLTVFVCLGSWASPTYDATAGIFTTDADNYTSVNNYSTVKFEKGFVFTGLESASNLNLGFAVNLSSIYIGAWYYGNILNSFDGTDNVSQTTTPNVEDGAVTFTSVSDTNSLSKVLDGQLFNTGVIVGIANMGFRLRYSGYEDATRGSLNPASYAVASSTINTVDTTDYEKITTYDPAGYDITRSIQPSILWGMSMQLGSITLKPAVGLDAVIYDESSFAQMTIVESLADSTLTYPQTTETKTRKLSYLLFSPLIEAEAVFENGSSAYLSYTIDPYLYTGSYTDAADAKTKVKGYVDSYSTTQTVTETAADTTTINTTDLRTSERWKLYQNLELSYKITKPLSERVSIGAAADVSMNLNMNKNTTKRTTTSITNYDSKGPDPADDYITTTTTTYADTASNTTSINVYPTLRTGITFAAVPQKLTLNFGYNVDFPDFSYTKVTNLSPSVGNRTETTTVDGNDVTTATSVTVTTPSRTESSYVATGWTTVSAAFTAGLCWNITENVKFDTVMNLPLAFSIDSIKAAGLSLAVSIKL